MDANTPKSWLWPDSRAPHVKVLRDEHNATVNAYVALLAERDRLLDREALLETQVHELRELNAELVAALKAWRNRCPKSIDVGDAVTRNCVRLTDAALAKAEGGGK